MYQNNRIEKLRKVLQANYCDTMLISKEENLHYFSGFTGDDTFLIITLNDCFLITDSRYTKQASEQTSFTIIEQKTGLLSKTVELIKKLNINSLAFEGNALIFNQYNYLAKNLVDIEVDFSTSLDLTELRIIKDENEIELIKKAINISDEAYSHILKFVKAESKPPAYLSPTTPSTPPSISFALINLSVNASTCSPPMPNDKRIMIDAAPIAINLRNFTFKRFFLIAATNRKKRKTIV